MWGCGVCVGGKGFLVKKPSRPILWSLPDVWTQTQARDIPSMIFFLQDCDLEV